MVLSNLSVLILKNFFAPASEPWIFIVFVGLVWYQIDYLWIFYYLLEKTSLNFGLKVKYVTIPHKIF